MRHLSILLVPFVVFCFACGSSDDDGGSVGSGGEAGNAGSTNEGGSAGSAGSAGGALDMHCQELTAVEGACWCFNDTKDNLGPGEGTVACSTASVNSGNSICCAGEGYPADSDCTCMPWLCSEESTGCYCGSHVAGSQLVTTCSKTYKTCCVYKVDGAVGLCTCNYEASCPSGQEQVADCSLARATCGTNESKVDRCTTE